MCALESGLRELRGQDLVPILDPDELYILGVEAVYMASQVHSLLPMITDIWGLRVDLQCWG